MKENKDHMPLEIEIEGMPLPIHFRFKNKKGHDYISTLLRISKSEFYSNILGIQIRTIMRLIIFGI